MNMILVLLVLSICAVSLGDRNDSQCVNGFMDLSLLVNKARAGVNGNQNTLLNGNELRLIANMSCNGNITSVILGLDVVRLTLIRNRFPEIQIWDRENDTFNRLESRQIFLTVEDFPTDGVYRYTLEPPMSFEEGHWIGIYQPPSANSAANFYYIPVNTPQLMLSTTNTNVSVSLSSFVLVNQSILFHPITTSPSCANQFLDMSTVVDASRNTQGINSAGSIFGLQRLFPSMFFSCRGSITKWTVGANILSTGTNLPELQVWRLTASTYSKVGFTTMRANLTNDLRVHVLYPTPAVLFEPGDILGIHVPNDQNSSLGMLYQDGNGPGNLLDNDALNLSPASSITLFSIIVGGLQYPLVTVQISTDTSSTSTVVTGTSSTSTVVTDTSSTSTVVPSSLSNSATYAIYGSLSGVILVLIVSVIILIATIIYLSKKQKHERRLAHLSLRDNQMYNTAPSVDNEDTVISNPHINEIYETVDDPKVITTNDNPSYVGQHTVN